MAQAAERVKEILPRLKKMYPESKCSLHFNNAYELLIATILSAQCTDERVNQVTPSLFRKFPDPSALSKAKPKEVEDLIRSTGFYQQKARSLLESAKIMVADHGGKVPNTMESLTKLRGVGRKTANVVLGHAFKDPQGVVVDTHVKRLARRMGLTRQSDPVKIELDLMKLVPEKDWILFTHLMIDHGRKICTARRAYCERCPLADVCPKTGI